MIFIPAVMIGQLTYVFTAYTYTYLYIHAYKLSVYVRNADMLLPFTESVYVYYTYRWLSSFAQSKLVVS